MKGYQVIIVGGGIVGLATALQLLRNNHKIKLAVLEKENQIAQHQTSHNSGVIHSGIYYKPGSLKAQNCIDGVNRLITFCKENHIPFEQCGKLIVALTPEELPRLEEIYRRGSANGVPGIQMLGPEQIKEIEPHAVGLRAIHCPSTGIIDYQQVAKAYAEKIKLLGGDIHLGEEVCKIIKKNDSLTIVTKKNEYQSSYLINCAGLHSDHIARMADPSITTQQIIPFRGEYYDLVPEKRALVKGLIYPVPDPKFPFLGVHLTRMINGGVEAGPNAVLALAKEGYKKNHINLRDCARLAGYRGMWMLGLRHWKMGLYEIYRSMVKKAFVKDVQRLMPAIQEKDLIPGNAGVRAQMVTRSGKMVDDFLIVEKDHMIHILNAPSPAATASLSIGHKVAGRAISHFNL